jgi:hypothetical protein
LLNAKLNNKKQTSINLQYEKTPPNS